MQRSRGWVLSMSQRKPTRAATWDHCSPPPIGRCGWASFPMGLPRGVQVQDGGRWVDAAAYGLHGGRSPRHPPPRGPGRRHRRAGPQGAGPPVPPAAAAQKGAGAVQEGGGPVPARPHEVGEQAPEAARRPEALDAGGVPPCRPPVRTCLGPGRMVMRMWRRLFRYPTPTAPPPPPRTMVTCQHPPPPPLGLCRAVLTVAVL